MSWSDPARRRVHRGRRRLMRLMALGGLAALGGTLSGCFRPMLAEGGAAHDLLGRVALPAVGDRFSYHLHQSLVDRLGRPGRADYRLEVSTRLERERLAITQDDAVTRISLTAVADWALYPAAGETPLLEGQSLAQSGYSSTASIFATRETGRDVERRLARELGERIARRLLVQADRLGPPAT